MKQTAVELLKRDLDSEIKLGTKMVVNWDMYLEVEKQQIMNAWYNGFEENRPYVDHSEDYYNKTYKQQDNEK